MNNDIKQRVLDEAQHIILTNDTLRCTARVFGVSKSTVHIDMSKRLKKINAQMYTHVSKTLLQNFCQKHIRGGMATAKKFKK